MTKELELKMRGCNAVCTDNGVEKWHTNAKSNERAELLDLLEKNDTVTIDVSLPHGLGKLTIECDRIYGNNRVVASFDKDMSLLLQTCELLSKMMGVSHKRLTDRECENLWDIFAHITKSNNLADGLPSTNDIEDLINDDRMDSRESERLCSAVR